MDKKKKSADAGSPPSFEEALARLETIVHDLEEGRLDLGDALARYEEGVKLLAGCHELLQKAERRIELLSGADADGKPVIGPFDEGDRDATEPDGPRRGGGKARKTRGTPESSPGNNDVDAPDRLF